MTKDNILSQDQVRSGVLTTLPTLPRKWMMEFLFKPTNPASSIRGNRENLDDRPPAIFFRPSQGFYFASSALTKTKQTTSLSFPRQRSTSGPSSDCPRSCRTGRSSSSSSTTTKRCSALITQTLLALRRFTPLTHGT